MSIYTYQTILHKPLKPYFPITSEDPTILEAIGNMNFREWRYAAGITLTSYFAHLARAPKYNPTTYIAFGIFAGSTAGLCYGMTHSANRLRGYYPPE